ncbi:MAG: hypothetical protein E6Q42_08850 [Dechloromonas sp.]|nr:MAG: hypothetical protein E6Q42_08850 [Dechloromonas sp.]
MSKYRALCVAAVLACCSFTASAADLLLTPSAAKGRSGAVALDIVTDGNVSGFNFVVRFGSSFDHSSVNVSKCLAELPKSFSGECRANKDGVYVFAMANNRENLAAGVTALGSIAVGSGLEKAGLTAEVSQLTFADADGNTVESNYQFAK